MINRVFITGLACLILQLSSFAQETGTFTVKAGESIADVLKIEEIFRYPEFLPGKVLYTNGSYIDASLNYNKVLGEMQFINSRLDTMVIANPGEISAISFPEDTFYVNEGYLELITGNDRINLVVRNYVKLMDVKKQGAYGMSSTGNVDSYTSVSSGTNTSTYQLKSNQDIIYSFKADYYFVTNKTEYVPARRKNLLKLYPENANDIKKFIKEESINFNRPQDLILMTEYLADLVE